MNSKMTTNYQQLNLNKNKNKLSKPLEQEQNQRNGDGMEGYQRGGGGKSMGKKVQGTGSTNGRYKISRERLKIVWEMEKPKNLYDRPMGMNQGAGGCWWEGGGGE